MDSELSRIEARLDAYAALLMSADADAEITDYVTVDKSRWTLANRLCATRGLVSVAFTDTQFVKGWIRGVGEDHVELSLQPDSAMLHAIVRLSTCRAISFLAQSQQELPAVPRTMNAALRTLARDVVSVSILTTTGSAIHGQLKSVHADHVEVLLDADLAAIPSQTISGVIVIG